MVARMVRDHKVVGSNPVASTKMRFCRKNRIYCHRVVKRKRSYAQVVRSLKTVPCGVFFFIAMQGAIVMKKLLNYFTKAEIALWSISSIIIITTFCIFDRQSYLTLAASLLGVTSLLLNAKGNPIGQLLMIIFSLLYGIISYKFEYYGEMITYLGMTMPMAIFALISWLKHPHNGNRAEVKVNTIGKKESVAAFIVAMAVTCGFYFILKKFNTANLIPSTISVTTSFIAVYLTFRRSPHFALAYAANDVVLIILWSLASAENLRYISVVACFCTFLVNDAYGFINWQRMKKRQSGT